MFPLSISLKTKVITSLFKVPRTKNIPKVPPNQAKGGHNHDARKAVTATLSVLK